MTFGESLKRIRIATGLSRKKLSDKIGIDQFRLQKWEDTSGSPKYEDAQLILKFFEVNSQDEITEEVLDKVISKINLEKGLKEKENNVSDNQTLALNESEVDYSKNWTVQECLKIIADLSATVKKQHDTIHLLVANQGNVTGRIVNSG